MIYQGWGTLTASATGIAASIGPGSTGFSTIIQVNTPALAGLLIVTHRGYDTLNAVPWSRTVLQVNLASVAGSRFRDFFSEYDDGSAVVDFQFVGVLGSPSVVYVLGGV